MSQFSKPVLAIILACTLSACGRGSSSATTFSAAEPLSRASTVGTAPMFAVSPSGSEAAAWVSDPTGGTDAKLYIAINGGSPVALDDSLGPIEAHGESPPKISYGADGALNAIYVVPKVVPGRRFPLAALRFTRSSDDGRTWSTPVTVTSDSAFGSHNFHALHVAGDGSIYVSWLGSEGGKSAVFMTRSADGGKSWTPNRRVAAGEACPCCRTALTSGPKGELYLGWRQVFPGSVRDIVVARSTDGGVTWSEPVRVHEDNWVFDACPHAGPSIQVDGNGRVHIAWWTGRSPGAGVYYARSDDGANTFGTATPLGVAEFSKPAHVQLALSGDSNVAITWDDGTIQLPQVVLRTSRDGGANFGQTERLSADGRSASFPVIGTSPKSGAIVVAWTEVDAAAAAHADHQMAQMQESKAPKGLSPVGNAQVFVRRGRLQ